MAFEVETKGREIERGQNTIGSKDRMDANSKQTNGRTDGQMDRHTTDRKYNTATQWVINNNNSMPKPTRIVQ